MKNIQVIAAYDLGGRLGDVRAAMQRLQEAYGNVGIDALGARSFNLSYLNWHDPIIRFETPMFVADIAGQSYEVERVGYIYPWLGVMHLTLDFTLPKSTRPDQLLDFYDGFVSWKNADYLPYLARAGSMTESLRVQTGFSESRRADVGELSVVVDTVIVLVEDLLVPRPGRYAFHDFRTIFITDQASKDEAEYAELLELVPSNFRGLNSTPPEFHGLCVSGVKTASTGWVTVVEHQDNVTSKSLVDQIQLLTRLAHAQWFVSQCWLYLLGRGIADGSADGDESGIYELARFRGVFAADAAEVGNADIMLKDPRLIRVSKTLSSAFNVEGHRRTAEERFAAVTEAETKRIERQRTLEAERLQLLFSISAAVAAASLVPMLASAAFPVAVTTVAIAALLCGGFIVNVALLIKRMQRIRLQQSRRKPLIAFISERVGG
ncbi:hypothetical protein [Cryobacterium serini]|uniref:Uncharacterized protein n=1 Tax=Cryobacterium serini TaxID=1259201 RepID=A0A4R9BUK6_9MICO|nr:hypothetical protein [Cryobacterium serini]TFD91218.1 hypothetical protein E3T51_00425 [Cryobacterium serini]